MGPIPAPHPRRAESASPIILPQALATPSLSSQLADGELLADMRVTIFCSQVAFLLLARMQAVVRDT